MMRFYDTAVEIKENKNSGGYSGDAEFSEVCGIMADVQPYRVGAAQKEYGIFEGVCSVMYCTDNEKLQVGMYAFAKDKKYVIAGIERRNLGMKIYLKEEV